jgi:succinate-semialdehyde dehydrogenase/glutarate-semialdehyde dehydrogenase
MKDTTMTIEPSALQCIAGQWRHGQGRRTLDVLNPANAQVVARFQAASAQDVEEALGATEAGFGHWRAMTALERGHRLRRAAALLRERTAEIAPTLTEEQGKTRLEAEREIEQAAQMIEWNAEEGRRTMGQTIPSRHAGVSFQTMKLPVGPVAALTPWNFPVMLSAIKVSAALAAGCSVILKPAEETPRAAAALVRCFHDAGIDGRVLQMLVGEAAQISSALIASPAIRKISFTGSTQVGRLLAQQAGEQLKPITLELGGHAPAIVCADADLARTVAALAQIKLRNAGQICANPSRFLVHRSLCARFVDAFRAVAENTVMGDGAAEGTTMGPLTHGRRAAAVAGLVEDARQRGARVVCGGRAGGGPGFFYEPTVLADVPPDARIWHEEPFGPLVPVMPFDTLDEAIAMANALPLGLAAFGFTQHLESARRLCEEVQAGAIAINTVTLMQPETPFGGVLDSGFGRENGPQSLEAYLVTRSVVVG